MNEPWSIEIGGVLLARDREDAAAFVYVPGAPGVRVVGVIDAGASMIVQLESRWEVPAAEIESLREAAARGTGLGPAASARLTPARMEGLKAELVVGADAGGAGRGAPPGERGRMSLAETTPSVYPPCTAVFNATIPTDARERVRQAMNGKAGLLWVRYSGAARIEGGGEATVSGRVPSDLIADDEDDIGGVTGRAPPGGAGGGGDDKWLAAIRRAVDGGAVTLRMSAAAWAPAGLKEAAAEGAMREAARALRLSSLMKSMTTPEVRGTAVLSAEVPIERWADVASGAVPVSGARPMAAPS